MSPNPSPKPQEQAAVEDRGGVRSLGGAPSAIRTAISELLVTPPRQQVVDAIPPGQGENANETRTRRLARGAARAAVRCGRAAHVDEVVGIEGRELRRTALATLVDRRPPAATRVGSARGAA